MREGRDEDTTVSATTHASLPPDAMDLEGLYEAYHTRVLQAAYRVTGNPRDAEDVLQTVFLRLAQRPVGRLEPNPEGYLYKAAINAALDVVRQRRRAGSVPLDPLAPGLHAPGSDPEQDERQRELEGWLRQAVSRLSEQAAEVFALHAFEGLDHERIADATGLTRNAVAVVLHRARRALRRDFEQFQGERR